MPASHKVSRFLVLTHGFALILTDFINVRTQPSRILCFVFHKLQVANNKRLRLRIFPPQNPHCASLFSANKTLIGCINGPSHMQLQRIFDTMR